MLCIFVWDGLDERADYANFVFAGACDSGRRLFRSKIEDHTHYNSNHPPFRTANKKRGTKEGKEATSTRNTALDRALIIRTICSSNANIYITY